MSRALAWIRKSKGSDDDIGLEEQREHVEALAEEVAADVDKLDLGVHTGFSSMTRDGNGLLDQNERVQEAVEKLRSGEYDYVVAWDDRRICRDQYLRVIEYACKQGGVEVVYYGDVQDDDLAYDIHRRVERQTKEEEIEKSRRALERREEKGYDHGRPPFGMTYDDNGHYWVPGQDFETAIDVIERRVDGESFRTITEATGVPRGTVQRIVERRERYLDAREAQKEPERPTETPG